MSYSSTSLRTSGVARSAPRAGTGGLSRSSSTASNGSTSADASGTGHRRQSSTDLSFANLDHDEDFERILGSYDVVLVADVLRRYLATEVQSNLAGTAASKQGSAQIKRQFYERFNQILDRLFGNDDVSKHKYGGWLDYSIGLMQAATSASSSAASASSSASSSASLLSAQRKKRLGPLTSDFDEELRMDSYVDSLTPAGRSLAELLGVLKDDDAGSMFQLMFKMTHPVEFKLEMDLLPEQSKMSLLNRSAFTSVLFTQLLQKPITKQRVDARNPVLLVSIKELFLFYFMRHPASANHQSSPGTSDATGAGSASSSSTTSATSADAKSRSSSIMGSLTDTFAGRPKRKENYSWRAFYTDGVAALVRSNPYNVLLLQYLKVFFPDSGKPVQSRFLGKLLQHSNLCLHILIEFWLRQNLIVFADDANSATTIDWSGYRMQQKLVSPLATVLTQTTYMAPSDDLLSSLLLTVIHLLSDSFYPAPLDSSSSSSTAVGGGVANAHMGMLVGSGGGYLSPSITVMRRPLYEFFRLVFSRAPIGLSPTAFLAITDVWLAYIQPWNCKHWAKDQPLHSSKRSTSDNSTDASTNSPTAYSDVWDTYVLANYHFYTTLLGGFIERAKELEFTGSDERALVILDRVLSVYTPDLLTLLRSASDFLDKNQPYSISSSVMQISSRNAKSKAASSSAANATADGSLSPRHGQVLTYHCKALGIECIGVPLHGNYHRDAERVFDKLWSDSGFLAGGAVDTATAMPQRSPRGNAATSAPWLAQPGETPFERVHRLSRQLRRVFEISDAYVASTAHARSLPSANGLEPLEPSRHSKLRHLLTKEGVNQLRRGMRLCSPEELSYIGDPMLRPICSYEIATLVRLSFKVSTWLNTQFGLRSVYHGKHFEDNVYVDPAATFTSFRFNLRFLASKPNLGFLTLFLWIVYLLLLW